eukprot:jgi/Mesvir1/28928/Mv25673-RA.2
MRSHATLEQNVITVHTYAGVGNNNKQAYIKKYDPGAMLVDMAALQGPGQALKPGLIGIMSSLLHILTALATIIAVSQLSFCSCEIGAEYDIDATFDLSSTSTGTSTANGGREMGASTSTLSGISQYNGQEGQENITNVITEARPSGPRRQLLQTGNLGTSDLQSLTYFLLFGQPDLDMMMM